MTEVPPEILGRLRTVLLKCESFDDDVQLQILFVDSRLTSWENEIPQAKTRRERVDLAIYYLVNRTHAVTNENALILLLRVLSERTSPNDVRHHELVQIARDLEHVPKNLEEVKNVARINLRYENLPKRPGCYLVSQKFYVAIVVSFLVMCSALTSWKSVVAPYILPHPTVRPSTPTLQFTPTSIPTPTRYPTFTPLSTSTMYPTFTPSPTPARYPTFTPSPTSTGTPTATQTLEPGSLPEIAVLNYYAAINDADYEYAWYMLSDEFKEHLTGCSSGVEYYQCAPFIDLWQNINRVNILESEVARGTSDTALVFVKLSYLLNDGRTVDDTKPYIELRFDQTKYMWVFVDKREAP